MLRPRPRWQVIQRLRRLQRDPLAPLVYIAIFGVLAYVLFIANWLTHQW